MTNPFAPSPEAKARIAALRRRIRAMAEDHAQDELLTAVIGGGRSGQAAAKLLESVGAKVSIFDDKLPSAAGPIAAEPLTDMDLVVLSPGVPRALAALKDAIRRGIVVGEIELASWFVRCPIVGITGTNGKSTTTALLAHIIDCSGKKVFAGGNLGRPLSDLVTSKEPVDFAVVELSSYQLESIIDATFDVACWLNVTPDHTDRYEDHEAYGLAKRRLLERRSIRGIGVVNAKDRFCADAGIRLGGHLRWFSAKPESDLAGPRGTVLPEHDRAVRVDGKEVEVYDLVNPALPGLHNRANMLAAIECARYLDVEPGWVQTGLRSFKGLPHRIELVGERDDVVFYNDSKATNIESAVTALKAVDRPKILIAGGQDKGAPWAPLVEIAEGKGKGVVPVKTVLAIGDGAAQVVEAFDGTDINVETSGTLQAAVDRAIELATGGDAVLLSPACASFDQFDNYGHRGDVFRSLVQDRIQVSAEEGGKS